MIRLIGLAPLLIGIAWTAIVRADPSDFIPGEKTLFYDDFSDMAKGSPPPHWKVRGAPVDVATQGELKGLRVEKGTNLYANLNGLPEDFTLEAELKFDPPAGRVDWLFGTETARYLGFYFTREGNQQAALFAAGGGENLGGGRFNV